MVSQHQPSTLRTRLPTHVEPRARSPPKWTGRRLCRSQWIAKILLVVILFAFLLALGSCKKAKSKKSKGKSKKETDAGGVTDDDEACSNGVCRDRAIPPNLDLKDALERYVPMHQRMLQLAADPATRHKARFAVFRVCCGELGNRLIALASSLLFALVSQRALLIDWPSVEGFSGDAYDDIFRPWHDLPVSFQSLLKEWSLPYSQTAGILEAIELNNARPEPFDHVLCQDLTKAFNSKVFVVLVTNQYFAPAIRQNVHHKDMVEALFRLGEEEGRGMFEQLLSHIARPQKALANRIKAFTKKHFRGKKVVGMQVRRQMRERDKAGAGTSSAHVNTYWDCAEEKARKLARDSAANDTVFFLATDHLPTREEARGRFGSRLVALDAAIATTSEVRAELRRAAGAGGAVSRKESCGGMAAALMDMWLLSECDAVVVTSGSTFGYVGHARRSLAPLVVTLDKKRDGSKEWADQEWEQPTCIQEVTSEPCFHVWPMMIPQTCFEGSVQEAMALWGQRNCRPWDMELFKFQ